MDLSKIGFYTLSEDRAKNASSTSRLQRCELILTNACNFKCPYCRGLDERIKKTLPVATAIEIIKYWVKDGLKNIRFSGGEPTVYPGLLKLVQFAKLSGIERIAISTNGYANTELYDELIEAGVNDISISFDACCSSFGDKMAGGIEGAWEKIVKNVEYLAAKTYVTLGVVVTEETLPYLKDTVEYGSSLGVADIRIISAAQFNAILEAAKTFPPELLNKYPILKYRVENMNQGRNVRGLEFSDSHRCGLVLDDMAIAGDFHFPCIIYMREQGKPIGKIGPNMRKERDSWYRNHNTNLDPICKGNCLDVCIDYNNRFVHYKIEKTVKLPKLSGIDFTYDIWENGSIYTLGVNCRTPEICSMHGRTLLKDHAVGWCFAESLTIRPKNNHVALMVIFEERRFWFHITASEFLEVFGEL